MRGWVRIVAATVALAVAAAVGLVAWAWRNPVGLYVWSTRRALDRAGFERESLPTAGGSLRYLAAGEGPALVFLHGAGDQAGAWAAVAPAFADRYRAVVPDLPGHGDSAPADGPLPMTRIVADVGALLDAVAPEGGAVVVGNSLGAWVACLVAAERPGRVARVVAVNGGPLDAGIPIGALVPRDRAAARELVARLRDPSARPLPDVVLDDLARRLRDGAAPRMFAARDDFDRWLLDGRLDRVDVPVDVVWGRSDRLFPAGYPERLASGLPAARLTWIERCGHAPQTECAEPFRETLARLLEQPPPGTAAAPAGPSTTPDLQGDPR